MIFIHFKTFLGFMYIINRTFKIIIMKKPLLYFDMEWVPLAPDFETLKDSHPEHAEAWSRRCEKWRANDKFTELTDAEIFSKEAGFYPEYIRIICISVGYYKDNATELSMDSFYGDDEVAILSKISKLLSKTAGKFILSGHSIKRYDMPFLAKRMAINGISIPWDLNNGNKKPWEIEVVDVAEEWGFGCNAEKYTPLDWICISLGVPTPKSSIEGSKVAQAYYKEGRMADIVKYCEADVIATAKVERKINELTNPSPFV